MKILRNAICITDDKQVLEEKPLYDKLIKMQTAKVSREEFVVVAENFQTYYFPRCKLRKGGRLKGFIIHT